MQSKPMKATLIYYTNECDSKCFAKPSGKNNNLARDGEITF